MKPRISVITAVYNSEDFIWETIENVLNQTFTDFEYIIINDGSSDRTKEIIESFNDKRIVLINNKENIFPKKALNIGLRKAKGKYIAIIDGDDVWEEDKLEVQYNFMEENKDIYLCGTSARYINERGRELRRFRKYNKPNILMWRLPQSCGIIHSSIIFRNTGEFFYNDEYPCAFDYALYLKMLSKGKLITNIPRFLVRYRVHGNSISSKREQQKQITDKLQNEYSYLNDLVGNYKKFFYRIFLLLFYLRTIVEKRGTLINLKNELRLRFTDDEIKLRRML